MGFMDKAKKLADQAQAKLDEVQKQFNENQAHPTGSNPSGASSAGPAADYDQHGRPVERDPEPPQGDPLGAPAPPAPAEKGPQLADEPDPEKPQGDPLGSATPRQPPKPPSPGSGMSSGDPLAG